MNFYKTAFFTSIYTIINLIAGLVIVKLTSTAIGPQGTALMGQFTNTVAFISLLATGAISTGVVKYTAEYRASEELLRKYIANAFIITFFCSVLSSILVIAFYKWLSVKIFLTEEFSTIFIVYGISLVVNSTNSVLNSILNGIQEIKIMTKVNIYSSIINLLLTVFLVLNCGLYGALLSLVIGQIFLFFILIWHCLKFNWFQLGLLNNQLDFLVVKNYLIYSSMIFVDLSIPLVFLYVRNAIIQTLSLEQAGYWQAMNTLSDKYMALIYAVLGVYYLPKLSELQGREEILKEMKSGYIRLIPIISVLSFLLWLCRDVVIHLLFTDSFLPMRDLFVFWVLGNIFGIAWSLISYLLVAKKMVLENYFLYFIFYGSFIWFNSYFIHNYGMIGSGYAYFLNRFCSFLIMLFFGFFWIKFSDKSKNLETNT